MIYKFLKNPNHASKSFQLLLGTMQQNCQDLI